MGRSIQNNQFLVREIREGIEDDTDAALISLDQSKAFDRADHRFLGLVLEIPGFEPEFKKWISILYHSPQAGEQEALGDFGDRTVGPAGLTVSSSLRPRFGASAT